MKRKIITLIMLILIIIFISNFVNAEPYIYEFTLENVQVKLINSDGKYEVKAFKVDMNMELYNSLIENNFSDFNSFKERDFNDVSIENNTYEFIDQGVFLGSYDDIFIMIYKDDKVIDTYLIEIDGNLYKKINSYKTQYEFSKRIIYDCRTRKLTEEKIENHNKESEKTLKNYFEDDRSLFEKIFDFVKYNFDVIFISTLSMLLILLLIGLFIKIRKKKQ